jgi:hypothetical protein
MARTRRASVGRFPKKRRLVNIAAAILAELNDHDLHELARRLRSFLHDELAREDGWLDEVSRKTVAGAVGGWLCLPPEASLRLEPLRRRLA